MILKLFKRLIMSVTYVKWWPQDLRGNKSNSSVSHPLDGIQIGAVLNPEPMGISLGSRFGNFYLAWDGPGHVG